ncbi:MAG: DnaJ domain-containing protein [bacterium]
MNSEFADYAIGIGVAAVVVLAGLIVLSFIIRLRVRRGRFRRSGLAVADEVRFYKWGFQRPGTACRQRIREFVVESAGIRSRAVFDPRLDPALLYLHLNQQAASLRSVSVALIDGVVVLTRVGGEGDWEHDAYELLSPNERTTAQWQERLRGESERRLAEEQKRREEEAADKRRREQAGARRGAEERSRHPGGQKRHSYRLGRRSFPRDLYEVLECSPKASRTVIKSNWKALMKEGHPDQGGDSERAKLINAAYEILSDPEARRQYDRENDHA